MIDNEFVKEAREAVAKGLDAGYTVSELLKVIDQQQVENEKLTIRLRKAEHQLDDLCKMYNTIKSEAYKEFADMLVDAINKDISLYGNCTVHSMALKINTTLKELTEKNDKE